MAKNREFSAATSENSLDFTYKFYSIWIRSDIFENTVNVEVRWHIEIFFIGGNRLFKEEAIKELEKNIESLKKRAVYQKDNEGKFRAIKNEIEVNEIAMKLMKDK